MDIILIFKILSYLLEILSSIYRNLSIKLDILSITIGIVGVVLTAVIGFISYRLTRYAASLSEKTDSVIKAINDLEFDSKIAVMAAYLGYTYTLERIREDLQAALNLKNSVAPEKQKRLVGFVIQILESPDFASLIQANVRTVSEIINISNRFKIDRNLKRDLRRLEGRLS